MNKKRFRSWFLATMSNPVDAMFLSGIAATAIAWPALYWLGLGRDHSFIGAVVAGSLMAVRELIRGIFERKRKESLGDLTLRELIRE